MTDTCVWTEIARVKPRPLDYRAVCSEPDCALNTTPIEFAFRDVAEAWARDHADITRHVVLIQAAGEK